MESGTGGTEKGFLGGNLGFAVERNRLELRIFVHEFVGGAVDAATRCEEEAFDAVALGNFHNHAGGSVVDLDGGLAVDFAGGIANDGGEMDDTGNTAHGLDDILNAAAITMEEFEIGVIQKILNGAESVDGAIQDANLFAGFEQAVHQPRADV